MEFIKSKKGTVITVVSGALTAVISLVMNLYLLPRIESTTEGIRCFDMNFGYGLEEARQFLSLLSAQGKALYLHMQLPLDFIYPIAYTLFFIFLLAKLSGKRMPLCALPTALMLFDYIENICTIIMLESVPSDGLIRFASAVTCVKTILMYAVFAAVIVCIIYRLAKRKKQ